MKIKYSRVFTEIRNELEKDILFLNRNTELFAIWLGLFSAITALLILAVLSNSLIIFSLLILTTGLITITVGYLTIIYFHSIQYGNKKQLLVKLHEILNKSFSMKIPFMDYVSWLTSYLKALRSGLVSLSKAAVSNF